MSTQSFKDIVVWQKSADLATDSYKAFENNRDYGFRDQIQRAAISIMNNVAEGNRRRSDKAFRSFLIITKGSAAEVQSMLILAGRLSYIESDMQLELLDRAEEISRTLAGFIKKLSAVSS